MWRACTILLGLHVAAAPALADNYICIADQAVGFIFDKSVGWHSYSFNVNDQKFTMTTEGGERVWKKVGDPLPLRGCHERNEYIECELRDAGHNTNVGDEGGILAQVTLNKKLLRYQRINRPGYVEGLDHVGDTPSIEIGRCSSM